LSIPEQSQKFDLSSLKEVGGIFKFGSGVLGKSAIALGVLFLAVIIAASRLHSDSYILAVIAIGVLAFFAWFFYVLKFAGKHPDVALLEGAEWTGYQRFQATAKGYIPSSEEHQVIAPGSQIESVKTAVPVKPDEEPR